VVVTLSVYDFLDRSSKADETRRSPRGLRGDSRLECKLIRRTRMIEPVPGYAGSARSDANALFPISTTERVIVRSVFERSAEAAPFNRQTEFPISLLLEGSGGDYSQPHRTLPETALSGTVRGSRFNRMKITLAPCASRSFPPPSAPLFPR